MLAGCQWMFQLWLKFIGVDPTTSTSWLGMSFESACSVVFRRHLAGPGEIFFSAPSNNAATTELQAIITMSREVFSGT